MSKPKYKVSVANTSVTIDERGYAGTLTFGVGGPIAADYFAKLANEINSLEEQLAQKDEALEAIEYVYWPYKDGITRQRCPSCGSVKGASHDKDCLILAALAKATLPVRRTQTGP